MNKTLIVEYKNNYVKFEKRNPSPLKHNETSFYFFHSQIIFPKHHIPK